MLRFSISLWTALCLVSMVSAQLVGVWEGKIPVGAISLRVILIVEEKNGKYSAKLDSPDQGAYGLPISAIDIESNKIRFTSMELALQFEGEFSENQEAFHGNWKQGTESFEIKFVKLEKIPDYRKPQDPKPPYPYNVHEVNYLSKKGGFNIGGTLTVPKTKGKHPAVILITGSGQQDRDETILGHKPFWVLADFLTRQGIAVLRVDDRGVGKTGGNPINSTSKDFAEDVKAGITFLKQRFEIDSKRIGLIGHSEGGLIAPMVAAESKDVAFIVLMAGPGVNGAEIINLQSALIQKAMGESTQRIEINAKLQKSIFRVISEESDNKKAIELIDSVLKDFAKKYPEFTAAEVTQVKASLPSIMSPWFRYFLKFEPKTVLQKVKVPVLAISGEKDLQVDPTQNLPAIVAALKSGGNEDFTVKRFPNLNHLFQTCNTGSPTEYSMIQETISPKVMEFIASWIKNKFMN